MRPLITDHTRRKKTFHAALPEIHGLIKWNVMSFGIDFCFFRVPFEQKHLAIIPWQWESFAQLLFQCSRLLDSPKTGEHGGKEIKENQGYILIIVEFPVVIVLNIMKTIQCFKEGIQILGALNVLLPDGFFSRRNGFFTLRSNCHKEHSLRRKSLIRG